LNDVFIFHPALKTLGYSKINLCTWPGENARAGAIIFTNLVGAQFIKDSFRVGVMRISQDKNSV
jgi:hypothetical protein